MSKASVRRNNALRRTAREAKAYSIQKRIWGSLLICLVTLVSIVYIISALYTKYGSFTVSVNKFDNNKSGLVLSETPDFDGTSTRLNAKMAVDISNMSGKDLPGDIDSINGSHNGLNYLAYTFYINNSGVNTVTLEYDLFIANVTNNVDTAVRFRLYRDGKSVTYARTRGDGGGAEFGTTEFLTSRDVVRDRIEDFAPGATTKFTVVIWIEGDDVDCTDSIIGGTLKSDMLITIVETSADSTDTDITD